MGRYDRQLPMPEIGAAGQKRLLNASALVVGAGGLGSALLFCLAGAGVGRIGVADGDTVSESNLNRQFLYTQADLELGKAETARGRLLAFRPDADVTAYPCMADAENAASLVSGYDVVLCAVDNLAARFALNAACVRANIPMVNGGVDGMAGQLQIVTPGSACFSCLYRGIAKAPQATSFPPVVSTVSSLMAQCALLLLLGQANPLENTLLHCDFKTMQFSRIRLNRDPACPVCGAPCKKA